MPVTVTNRYLDPSGQWKYKLKIAMVNYTTTANILHKMH